MKLVIYRNYTYIKGLSLRFTNDHLINVTKRPGLNWEVTLYLDGWYASLTLRLPPVIETGRLPF